MNYKERLNNLAEVSKINHKLINEVKDIDLKFDNVDTSSLKEFSDWVLKYMNKYNIGKKVSKKFWGVRGYQEIQTNLYDKIKQQLTRAKPVSSLQLYDDLKKDVDGKQNKDYSAYDYSRVARTEGKSLSVIFQLEKLREAGIKKVIYTTRGDNKVRRSHALLNGKEYDIDYLLSPEGEKDRIPIDPNCRCRYKISMRGL